MATEENEQPATREPVGQQLQKAREQAGLSVNDVASAQHLRPSVIQAIEAGDHSKIDSELFLKGYVRTYARQVGLDADAVIASLDDELEPLRIQREQEQEANPLVDIERRRRRKRQLAKVLFFAVVLGVAGYLVFSFVLPQAGTSADSPSTTTQPESSAVDPADPAASEDPELASEAVTEPASAGTESAVGQESQLEESPVEEAPVSEPIPAVVQSPEPVLEDPNGFGDASDAGRLEIAFSGNCWVQVVDAEGDRLVNSLQREGDRIDVTGTAPLKVVIGAVDAVESIRFEGEPVEIDGFRVVNNRTEFTLTL